MEILMALSAGAQMIIIILVVVGLIAYISSQH